MVTDDLGNIESALALRLPARYHDLIQAYPLDPANVNHQIELQNNAKAIIAFNRFLRENFTDDWSQHYFAFGNSPCGDPYFLDLANDGVTVYMWDHETHEVTQEAPDLDKWVAQRK